MSEWTFHKRANEHFMNKYSPSLVYTHKHKHTHKYAHNAIQQHGLYADAFVYVLSWLMCSACIAILRMCALRLWRSCRIDEIRHVDAMLYNIHHIYYFVWTDEKSHQQACMHTYIHTHRELLDWWHECVGISTLTAAAAAVEVTPTSGDLAPRGGANNVCDPKYMSISLSIYLSILHFSRSLSLPPCLSPVALSLVSLVLKKM